MESKNRVFLALYLQNGLSEPHRRQLGLSFYHWSIWIEPKGAKDDTPSHCFDIVLANFFDGKSVSTRWSFRYDQSAQALRSSGLLLRVMVGKIPQQVNIVSDILKILHDVPLPNPLAPHLENDVSWTAEALLFLQERGYIESFDVPELMQQAAESADQIRKGRLRIGGKKINAVGNRKFP